MKLLLLFLAVITPALGGVPTATCTLGGNPCPTGSICTQTETCRGQCIAAPTQPPVIPCTVGNNGPCPTGSTCTPTMTCTASLKPCGGQCIAVPTQPAVIACKLGNNGPCPTGSTCTPTMSCPPAPTACGGQCIATPAAPVACIVGANDCPKASTCTQTMVCGGLCISTANPTSTQKATSTAQPCGGRHHRPCPADCECVRAPGRNCGPDFWCHGICSPGH